MDQTQIKRFLTYVKKDFAEQPHQKVLRERDLKVSTHKARNGAHSRWGREMQRRAGNKTLWEMISFTGSFAPDFLQDALARRPGRGDQPAADPRVKAKALEARTNYRLGKRFAKLRARLGPGGLQHWQRDLADLFTSGALARDVNEKTRVHGHGRLRTTAAFPLKRPRDPLFWEGPFLYF